MAPHGRERELPWTRAWFVIYVLWMAGWAACAVGLLGHADQGDGLALRAWILALMCVYLSLCNFFLPLPTAWIILLAASPDYALVDSAWPRMALVAGLATLATVVANLNEYHLLSFLLHYGLGARIRRTSVYGWAVRWFDRAPFQLLTLMAFIPIPVDAVRWLAILRGFPRLHFALAYLVGRGPRYLLFAGCSVLFKLTGWQILAIQLVMIGAAAAARVLWHAWQVTRSRRRGAVKERITVEAAAEGAPEQEPRV